MSLHEPSALVVAHPGHELRLYGWVRRERPRLSILTTGSRSGRSDLRLQASRSLAQSTGSKIGPLFGAIVDRDFYDLVLAGEENVFHEWTTTLREQFCTDHTRLVVVDGWQMYNVAHDLVHVMARVAAFEASQRLGSSIECLEYSVVPDALTTQVGVGPAILDLKLEDAVFEQKAAAASDYPDIEVDLDEVIRYEGVNALRHEVLRNPPPVESLLRPTAVVPFYERFGEERVSVGLYREVLRWQHMRPLVKALLDRNKAIP